MVHGRRGLINYISKKNFINILNYNKFGFTMPYLRLYRLAMHAYLVRQRYALSLQKVFPA